MYTPQAAASLFGPQDPSSDPFAVFGEESAQDTASPLPQEEINFLNSTAQGEPYHHQQSYLKYDAQTPPTWDPSSTNVAHEPQQYSAYEPTSVVMHYEPDRLHDNSYGAAPAAVPQQAEMQYNPPSYLPPASQPTNTWNGAQAPAVERYVPAASSTAPSYDPYSHANTSAQYSSYGAPAYAAPAPSAVPAKPSISAPGPPSVTKALERPKVSNAYDPPFPTTKARRPGRSTAHPQQTYGSYSAYQAPAVAPTAPPPIATPPPLKGAAYNPPDPSYNAYSRGEDHGVYAQPAQPPRGETSSPYASQLPPRKEKPSAYAPEASAKGPPLSNPEIPHWAVNNSIPPENVALNQPEYISDLNEPSNQWSPEQSNAAPHDFETMPNGVPFQSQGQQSPDLIRATPPVASGYGDPKYEPTPPNNCQPLNLGSPEPNHDMYQPPNVGATLRRAESPMSLTHGGSSGSSPRDVYLPPKQVYSSPPKQVYSSQVYSPPTQGYSPPQQLYSSPPRSNDVPQEDRLPASGSTLDQSAYRGSYASPALLSQSYEPSSIVTSDSMAQFNQVAPHSTTSLHAHSTAYAPSPSLLGSNDPLARTTARAPVINFGFGGRLVTCFHGGATLSTGFDVALSNRNTTSVKVRILRDILPKSYLEHSGVEYPGPLFPDSTSSSITLVRTAASAQSKSKKPRIVKYLEGRAAEISQGLAYLSPHERELSEAKLVLAIFLKILVENDGQILGSPQSDAAVRTALIPETANRLVDSHSAEFASPNLYSTSVSVDSTETPISITTLTSAALTKIEALLMRGERREAYTYALDQKLWAHAMVIASSIDKEAWKEVVNDFIHTELATKDDPLPSANNFGAPPLPPSTSKRESLRAAYSLFSGQGASAIKELVPTKLISLASGLQPHNMLVPTPRTPAFPSNAFLSSPPPASLSQWKETVAMMIACPLSQDASSALTALGDQLISYGWVDAAHACYLLSPQTSQVGGGLTPSARIMLLGWKAPQLSPLSSKDPDAFILTEILEYALSLNPVAKGLETFNGLPHLQAYRLVRASALAEVGDIQLANRYCEAISSCFPKGSPYFNSTLVDQLQMLTERINGVAHSEKSGSWIGGKISKPSLDTIGGWLDRRFTKLVTGDGDSESVEDESKKAALRTFDGPFTHYSTISTVPSARSSPQPTPPQHNSYAPPQRTSSAMAVSAYNPAQPHDRSSSAMDYSHHGGQAPVASFVYGNHPNHSSPALGLNMAQMDHAGHMSQFSNDSKALPEGELETPIQGSSWWDYSSAGNAQTPTAATFMKVEEPVGAESTNGFISLMDNHQFDFQTKAALGPPAPEMRHDLGEEHEEDLGFGNRKVSSRPSPTEDTVPESTSQSAPAPGAPSQSSNASPPLGGQQQASGGWLSRWWKGSETSPGPIKAKLGEENSFYYDKDLKRWVNKKAGGDVPKVAPPPPPPRAATASPSRAVYRPSVSSSAAPPARSSSAMDFSSPGDGAGRVRSNLVPTLENDGPPTGGSRPPSAAPLPPPGSRPSSVAPGNGPPPPLGSRPPSAASGPTPPGSRPRSQAAKRNIRSRYVDVLQQDVATGH